MKGIFLSVPSVSVSKTLTLILDEIAANGYEVIYYNAKDFEPDGNHHFSFRAYPDKFTGYFAGKMDAHTSYFDFGEILINSAESLIDFLISEVNIEKPDFIVHSHLAVWGKLIAQHLQIPAVTLYTTFILDKRIMLPFFRKRNEGKHAGYNHVNEALSFYRKCDSLYTSLQLDGRLDIWDVYINKGDLNLCFILEHFQHQKHFFDQEFHFLGYPTPLEKMKREETTIYISMGTVFNAETEIYQLCIDVLNDMEIPSIVSVGSKGKVIKFKNVSKYIRVEEFVEQREVLKGAKLFITSGGMASVHEAIYTCTPMIVIPIIPEQQLTAEKIAELGIGVHIQHQLVRPKILKEAILEVLHNHETYVANLQKLCGSVSETPPEKKAVQLISTFLANHYQSGANNIRS